LIRVTTLPMRFNSRSFLLPNILLNTCITIGAVSTEIHIKRGEG
jgi:hypothetical protein